MRILLREAVVIAYFQIDASQAYTNFILTECDGAIERLTPLVLVEEIEPRI